MGNAEPRLRLVLATRNRHKVEELSAMLRDLPVEILSFEDFPAMPDVVEDGDTLEANAIKKASEVAAMAGLPALADDTGLEVDALGGAPGVRSARYASEEPDWEANNRKLLRELKDVPDDKRGAAFRCVIALSTPDGDAATAEGVTRGSIARVPVGEGGFGYDPLFLPRGMSRTYAQLSASEKNAISHRGRAISAARGLVEALLNGRCGGPGRPRSRPKSHPTGT